MSLSNFRNYNLVSSWKPNFSCCVCRNNDFGQTHIVRPFILDCFHSVCHKCIFKLKPQQSLTCKICNYKTRYESKQNLTEKCEPNFYLRGFLYYAHKQMMYDLELSEVDKTYTNNEIEISMIFNRSNTFQKCDECTASTQYICLQCNVPFCQNCFDKIHKLGNALKKHSLVKNRSEHKTIEKKAPTVCQKHKAICESFCRYCQKITCDQCIAINHSRHVHLVVSLENENIKYLKELNRVIDIVEIKKKNYQKSIEDKSVFVEKYEKFGIEAVGMVAEYFCKLHAILQYAERNTLLSIKQNVTDYKRKIDVMEAESIKTIENLDDMVTSLQDIAKTSARVHLKKAVEATNHFLEFTSDPIPYPQHKKNPFILEEMDELEIVLRDLCPYKLTEEIKKPKKKSSVVSDSDIDNKNDQNNQLLQDIMASSLKKNFSISTTPQSKFRPPLSPTKKSTNHNVSELAIPSTSGFNKEFKSVTEISPKALIQKVKISHFNDPNDFYVQFKSFLEYENKLNLECEAEGKINETPSEIHINNIYLIRTKKNIWRRGKILKEVKPQTFEVFMIDIGEKIVIGKQFITSISSELKTQEAGAKKCQIYGIKPKGINIWRDDVLKMAKELLIDKNVFLVIVRETVQLLLVDVITIGPYPLSFRSALKFTDMAELETVFDKKLYQNIKLFNQTKKKELIPPITRAFYSAIVKEFTQIRILPTHIVSPTEFYVIQYDMQDERDEFNKQLKEFYATNNVKVYWPRVNMKCAVNINDYWYRCRIIKVEETLYVDVFLVDQGYFQTVHYTKLSFLDGSHCTVSEFSFRCCLIDIEALQENNYEWTEDAVDEFKRIMKHSFLKIFVQSIFDFVYKVTMKIVQKNRERNVNALMVQYGHATSTGPDSLEIETIETTNLESIPEIKHKTEVILLPCLNESKFLDEKDDHDKIESPLEEVAPHKPPSTPSTNKTHTSDKIKLYEKSERKKLEREEVIISHIESPGEFYLHLKKYNDGIKNFHESIQKRQENMLNDSPESQMKHDWKVKDNCLVFVSLPDTTKKQWYRGKITKVDSSEVDGKTSIKFSAFLLDYGLNVKDLSKYDLSPIQSSDLRIAPAALKCHLACVKPTGGSDIWSNAATDAFKDHVQPYDKTFATIQGESVNSSIPTILWGLSTEIDDALLPTIYKYVNINKALHNVGFVELVEKFDRDKQIMKLTDVKIQQDREKIEALMLSVDMNLREAELKKQNEERMMIPPATDEDNDFSSECSDNENDEFQGWGFTEIDKTLFTAIPTYVDYEGLIYLHDAVLDDYVESIKRFINQKIISKIDVTKQNFDKPLKPGQSIIVKYHGDQCYHRGEILSICEDIIKVYFVDYGNVEECTRDEIIDKVCLKTVPKQAVKYKLFGVKPNTEDDKWPQSTLDIIHLLIVTKMCSISVQTKIKNLDNSNDLNESGIEIKECSINVEGLNLAEYLIESKYGVRSAPIKVAEWKELSTDFDDDEITKKIDNIKLNSPLPSKKYCIKYLNDEDEIENDEESNKETSIEKNNLSDEVKLNEIETATKKKESIVEKLSDNELSDDEDEILRLKTKKNVVNVVDHKETDRLIDTQIYKELFNKEELNKYYNSMISGSLSNDEADEDAIEYRPMSMTEKVEYYQRSMLLKRVNKFENNEDGDEDEDQIASMNESFTPLETSTVVSTFEGLNKFNFYKIPFGLKEFYCEIHYIENLTKFYISPKLTDLKLQYVEMMKRIQSYVKSAQSYEIEAEEKKTCLALFGLDNLYYRGLVKEIKKDEQTAEILYVDFLNTDFVPFEYIKSCPQQFMSYPLRLTPVTLHGVKPNPRWREPDIKSMLHDRLNERKVYVEIKKSGKIPKVDFFDSKSKNKLILQDLYDDKIFLSTNN